MILFQIIPVENAISRDPGDYCLISDRVIIDSLSQIYGKNKVIPKDFELQCLIVLSHFPELKNTHIEFTIKQSFAPLSAFPKIGSLFLGGDKRKFQVIISDKSTQYMDPILLKNLPFNAQLGVLGHELSHIVDYLHLSWFELIAVAMNYALNPSYHAWLEKKTDLITINHGLGWGLYTYYKFARSLAAKTPEANWANDYYLHYNEVLFEMQKRPYYNEFFLPNTLFKSRNLSR